MNSDLLQELSEKATKARLFRSIISDRSPSSSSMDKWMDMLGFNECSYRNINLDQARSKCHYSTETGLLQNKFMAGWLITPTVKELLENIERLPLIARGDNKITPVLGVSCDSLHKDSSDFSVIQVASQLNALEHTEPDQTPENGICIYLLDNTQGPKCALNCAPGTFVRNYYYGKLNTLENVGLNPTNGYLIFKESPPDLTDDQLDQIKIPVMTYTQYAGVTYNKGDVIQHERNKLLHQVYSSSIPSQIYGAIKVPNKFLVKFLTAQYTGAIAAGILMHHIDKVQGVPEINLTLIGGGSFNNPTNVIVKAIKSARNRLKNFMFNIKVHCFTEHSYIRVKEYLTPRWVTTVPNSTGGDNFFKSRDYQIDMVDKLSPCSFGGKMMLYDKVHRGQRVVAFVSRESDDVYCFIGDDGLKKYIIDINQEIDYTFESQPDGSYKVYDQDRVPVTKWH